MKKSVLLTTLLTLVLLCVTQAQAAVAGPHLTLTPSSGNQTVGDNFSVIIGVDSGSETSAAVDVFGTYDSTKLDIVSMDKVTDNLAFPFVTETHFQNATGKFDFACSPSDMSNFDDKAIKGDLVKVTFKAKAAGVATMNFTCQAGSEADSNIFKTSGSDIIDCASNQSGSFTISPGVGGDSGATAATATPRPTGQLPETGVVENTIVLTAFGLVSIVAALFLRLI